MFKDAPGGVYADLTKTDTMVGSSLAMEVIRYVNHSPEITGKDVCDGVVEW